MRKLRINHNEKGFTLIELMIVIAIIGILSAIAIPNFIAYRNKSFCSAAESDANSVASAIANYFSIPSNTSVTDGSLESDSNGNEYISALLTNDNTWDVTGGDDPNTIITVTVADVSGRCPDDYQDSMGVADSPRGYWDGSNNYIKSLDM